MPTKDQLQRVMSIGIHANESDAVRSFQKVDAALKATRDRTEDLSRAMAVADSQFKAGEIEAKAYARAMEYLTLQQQKHIDKLTAQQAAYKALIATRREAAEQTKQLASLETIGVAGYGGAGAPGRSTYAAIDPATGRSINAPQAHSHTLGAGSYSGSGPGGRSTYAAIDPATGRHINAPQAHSHTLGTGSYSGSGPEGRSTYAAIDPATGQPINAPQAHSHTLGTGIYSGSGPGGRSTYAAIDPATGRSNAPHVPMARVPIDYERIAGHRESFFDELQAANQQVADELSQQREDRRALSDEGRDYMQRFDRDPQKRRRDLAEADDLHRRGAISAREHAQAVSEVEKKYSTLHRGLNQVKGVGATLFGPLTLAVAAGGAAYKAYDTLADYQMSFAKMKALTGSEGATLGVMNRLRGLTSSSPTISFGAANKAASTLIQYGGNAATSPDTIRSIGALTGGNSETMASMTLAYAQTQGAGRLMGQELLQMINSGFNPLSVISQKTGESMTQLKKRMEDGGISAREVADAFREATSETGKWGGALNEMANTLPGRLQRIKSELEKLVTGGGDAPSGGVLGWLSHAGGLVAAGTRIHVGGQRDDRTHLQGLMDRYNLLGSSFQGADVDAALSHMGNISDLLKRENLSPSEALAVKMYRQSQADQSEAFWDTKNMDLSQIMPMWDRYQELMKSGDTNKAESAFVEMVNAGGGGHFRDAQSRGLYERYKQNIADRADMVSHQQRIENAFADPKKRAYDSLIDGMYGDYADSVRAMRSVGNASQIDNMIGRKASWQEIRGVGLPTEMREFDELAKWNKEKSALTERVKAEKDMANAIEEQQRAKARQREKFHEDVRDIEREIKFKKDLISLGREEANITQIMSEYKVTRREAQDMWGGKRRLELMQEISAEGTPIARGFGSGSQEEWAAKARAQSGVVAENIRVQRETLRVAMAQLVANNRTNQILSNLETV